MTFWWIPFITGLSVVLLASLYLWIAHYRKPAPPTETEHDRPDKRDFEAFADRYQSIEEVHAALRKAGLQSSNLIVGIDFSKSNRYTGRKCFGGNCLHALSDMQLNPYQKVLELMGKKLEIFDDDKLIPCFGFADGTSHGTGVFPWYSNRVPYTFNMIISRYKEIVPHVVLGGPTNLAPIIREAIHIVSELKAFHILLIISDGQIVDDRETSLAIIEASKHPLSIILVGVGDGPWDQMREYDDWLTKRKFDNFQFVCYAEVMDKFDGDEDAFALHALMEIPEQYKAIVKRGL